MSRNYRLPVLNKVVIVGNLTKDPDLRKTAGGAPVSNFRIASSRKFRDSTGQTKEEVCYIGIVTWNRLADACYDFLRKGSSVLVEGELQSRNWENEEGAKRNVIEIRAHKVQFLDRREQQNDEEYFEDENYEDEGLGNR